MVFDARYQGIARIEYALHPLFGREGRVIRQVKYVSMVCLELEIDSTIVSVQRWMTNAELCSRFACGCDPQPDLGSLMDVLRLLEQLAQ